MLTVAQPAARQVLASARCACIARLPTTYQAPPWMKIITRRTGLPWSAALVAAPISYGAGARGPSEYVSRLGSGAGAGSLAGDGLARRPGKPGVRARSRGGRGRGHEQAQRE